MPQNTTQHPTSDELAQSSIRAYKGIEIGLGQADPGAVLAQKLERKYPDHLAFVQVGSFLHGYDRTAYALHTLKNYKLKLVGTTEAPHIRVGFPAGNFKKRLWSMVDEFEIPYAVLLGSKAAGYTVYVSEQHTAKAAVLSAVSPDVVRDVIADLRARGTLNQASVKQMLANPDSSGFRLKSLALELDTHILHDIIKMPRDLRETYGENLRANMARIMSNVFAYGNSDVKGILLNSMSADVDLMKHYMTQAPRLNKLKLPFDERAGLAVELGRLVGGLIRAQKAAV